MYSQVLTIARDIKRGLEKKERSQVMNKTMKKPFLRGFKRMPPVRPPGTPLAKWPFQSPQQMVCGYCQKSGHNKSACRLANGLCLACGSSTHALSDCPHKRLGSTTLTPSTLPSRALPAIPPVFSALAIPPTGLTQSMRRNPALNNKGMALPSQQPTQKGARPGVC